MKLMKLITKGERKTIQKLMKEYFLILKLNIYLKVVKNYKQYLQMHFTEFMKYLLENMETTYKIHGILQVKLEYRLTFMHMTGH